MKFNHLKTKSNKRWCTKCRMSNHDTEYCKRFCAFHKSDSHWTSQCRNKSGQHQSHATKSADADVEDDHHFSFYMMNDNKAKSSINNYQLSFLVDSGATVHILNKKEYLRCWIWWVTKSSDFWEFSENIEPCYIEVAAVQ